MASFLDKSVISSIFIGRTPQLAALEHGLAQVSQGRSQIMLVAGEAGIGKSRLVAEMRTRAEQRGWQTVQGRSFEPDVLFPYAPLLDLLRSCLARRPVSEVTTLLGPLAAEIVKLLPELGLMLPNLHPTPRLDAEAEKRRLFETLIHFFTQLPAPLLVIVEDLHWSDDTSLEFLRYLARRLTTHPLLLLLTYRSDEMHPALHHFLAALDREQRPAEVALPRFTPPEVDALLRAIIDLQRPVRAEFLEALCRLTSGNPFFIEEVLKALIATGDLFYSDGAWDRKPMGELQIPRSVQDAVQRRVLQLTQAARHTLTLAAVAGHQFDFAVLQAVTRYEETELLAQIKELVTAQLVVEASAEHFSFRHALTREAVYSGLLLRERQALHQQIGETIEQLYTAPLESHVSELAYHFYVAGVWEKALHYARRAGEQAQALYTPHAAIEQFTRAVEAAQHLGQTTALPDLYRARGLAYEIVGNFALARADQETVLHLARTTDNRQLEWQALLDLGQLWASRNYDQTGDYFRRALAVAHTLDDPEVVARTLNRVGNWHLNLEEPQEALRYHQAALTLFEGLNDCAGLAATLDFMGMASNLSSDLIRSAAYCEQATALFRELNDRKGFISCLTLLPILRVNAINEAMVPPLISSQDIKAAGELAVQTSYAIGWRAGESFALQYLGLCLAIEGEYASTLNMLQRALTLATEIEHRQWMAAAHRSLGMFYLDLLALPAAHQNFERAWMLARELGSTVWGRITAKCLALTFILQHEFLQAETILNTALAADAPAQTLGQRLIWFARAELALARNEPEQALQIAERLIASAVHVETAGQATIPLLMKLRGEALTVLQRWSEAEAALQLAHTGATTQGARPLLWRIKVVFGKLYQAQSRHADAEQAFSAARTIIAEIAATVSDIELRDNFVRRANAMMLPPSPATPLRTAKQTYAGLTRREREVAVLIAQGKSNRAIAEALVIGERTVEGYVSNMLNKLGFTSRTQIATWVAYKGLTKDDAMTE